MKIQMLEGISGPLGSFRPGDIWDHADDADAARIVAAGFAVRVDEPVEPKAVENPEAKASAKRSKR